jgi:flagella basal body P-ring formation protein FlgA
VPFIEPKYIEPRSMRPKASTRGYRLLGQFAVLALLALAVLSATDVRAAPTEIHPLAEIRAAAISAMGAVDAQAEATLDPALRMARCSQPLEAVASGPKTAQVRCADTPGWRLYVPVRVRREADVVVLTAPAASGVPIAASQLTVQRRDTAQASGVAFTDPASLAGRIPRRAMAAGQAPTETDLATGTLLRRGDPVVLVSRTGGVEVRMQGRVLGAPQSGGTVSVENTTSHRVLRGRIVAEGEIEITP